MTRNWYRALAALLELAPAAIAIRYWQVWNRLPLRVATHFDATGRANGWMSRLESPYWSAGFLAFLAAVFFVALRMVEIKYPMAKLPWALLAFFHAEMWTFVAMMNSMLEHNLSGRQISIALAPLVTGVGAVAILFVVIGENRGKALSATKVIAVEVHSGKKWSVLLLAPVVFLGVIAARTPSSSARLGLAVGGAVLLGAFAMAWDGFQYFFTRHGVEIRTLGFRLQSIPLLHIKSYDVASWNPLRGLGIRGVGNRKAYIWGSRGVRVQMYDGEIFLGADDPQKIIQDLNAIKGLQAV